MFGTYDNSYSPSFGRGPKLKSAPKRLTKSRKKQLAAQEKKAEAERQLAWNQEVRDAHDIFLKRSETQALRRTIKRQTSDNINESVEAQRNRILAELTQAEKAAQEERPREGASLDKLDFSNRKKTSKVQRPADVEAVLRHMTVGREAADTFVIYYPPSAGKAQKIRTALHWKNVTHNMLHPSSQQSIDMVRSSDSELDNLWKLESQLNSPETVNSTSPPKLERMVEEHLKRVGPIAHEDFLHTSNGIQHPLLSINQNRRKAFIQQKMEESNSPWKPNRAIEEEAEQKYPDSRREFTHLPNGWVVRHYPPVDEK